MFVTETKYNITFMKKTWIIIIAVIAVIAIYGVSSYNSMVSQEEAVGTAWSNVENQYQRRADLIPNLVNTVKGYAAHEKETFDAVVSARAKATQTTVSIDDLTPEKMEAYQRAQGEVGSALSRLLAVTENYPELKANENFQTLQAQLEGTENRISVERRNFNDVRAHTMHPSAASRRTFLPACSDSKSVLTSKLRKVLKKLRKLNSDKNEKNHIARPAGLFLYHGMGSVACL